MSGWPAGFARLVAGCVALVLAGVSLGPGAGSAAASPLALTEPREQLERALECGAGRADRAPVILVHGTGSTPEESFSFGYEPALKALGFEVCTVRLPERGTVDMQRSMQYVVYAIREVARRSGRKVSLVGHSQGAALAVYAPYFWPDLPPLVDDVIGLAGPYHGTTSADESCAGGSCPAFAWQFRTTSRLSRAYGERPRPSGPSFTAIATELDELITPAPQAAMLDGARNITIQRLCPARPIEHYLLVADAVAYAYALDALTHPGAADPARVSGTTCAQTIVPGADLAAAAAIGPLAIANAIVATRGAPAVSAEPELRCPFDASDCPAPQLRLTRRCASGGRLRVGIAGDVDVVRGVSFKLGKRTVRRATSAPYASTVGHATLRRSGSRRLRAVVELKPSGRVVLARSLPRC